jgi:hypothetical protein
LSPRPTGQFFVKNVGQKRELKDSDARLPKPAPHQNLVGGLVYNKFEKMSPSYLNLSKKDLEERIERGN